MRRGIVSLSGLLLAVLLTGCGDDGGTSTSDGDATSAESPSTPADATSAESSPGEGPQLKLHDPGAEPRSLLRFDVDEGDQQRATMTMRMDMSAQMNGQRQAAAPIPTMEMDMLVSVTDVAEDGELTAEFGYDGIRVLGDDAQAGELERVLEPVTEITGTLRATSTGMVVHAEIDLPEDVEPTISGFLTNFESQISNMASPLPEEEVGEGARWTVTATTDLGGVNQEVAYHYRLVEVQGDGLTLEVTYEQTAEDQDMELPGLPAGSAHLDSLRSTGSGESAIELGLLFPRASEMSSSGSTRMTVANGGRELEMVQKMDIEVSLRSH